MKSAAFRFKSIAIVLAAALAVACGFACPARAFAASDVVAYSGEGATRENYSSVSDAISAGYSGKTIVMAKDWESSGTITIADSKSVTIDMNGHCIKSSSSDYAIRLNEHATLTLTSSVSAEFSFSGYDADSDEWSDLKLTSGGLITDTDDGAGIRMDKWSTVKLVNVAVAGNDGSGVVTKDECTLEMSKGASIRANHAASRGGGVEFSSNCSLTLDNAYIEANGCNAWGGGVFASSGLTVDLKNGAKIDDNRADAGGGVYLNKSKFSIVSSDKTGSISNNIAAKSGYGTIAADGSGGGIHVDSYSGENEGLIKGINIKNNSSYIDGGAIELDQEYTRVVDCVITGNKATMDGGGVYVNNDECSIVGCTITDNACNVDRYAGNNHEGGGVFVSYKYDLYLNGVCTIKNNIRANDESATSGAKDDLFLSTISGSSGYAYIKGGVEDGSSVGIRTGIEGERLLGKSISTYVAGTYFSDIDGYWISHGSDHDGDLWQRTGATVFNVYVNGASAGQYAPGDAVILQAACFANGDRFWRWSSENSSGLSPFSSYVENIYDPCQVFYHMPQNDVELAFDTYDLAGSVTLMVDKPVAGEALAATARVYVADGRFEIVPITWTDAGGATVTAAEYGGAYSFSVSAPRSQSNGFGFSEDITKDNVRICWTGSDEVGLATASASVDSEGKLNATSAAYETEKLLVTSVDDASANVLALSLKSDLLAAIPSAVGAKLSNGSSVALAIDKDKISWPDGLLDGDSVEDVGNEAATFKFDLPLAESTDVPDAKNHVCGFTLTVLPTTEIAPPAVSLAGGTYNRYSGATKLGDDLKLNVTVSCSAKDAKLYYSVDGGKECAYTSDGISLVGEQNESVTRKLEVWAVRGDVESSHVTASYVLDDTLNKEVKIACADTALYGEGDARWSDELTITANIGDAVSVTAPTEDSRTFDHWEWTGRPTIEDADLAQETLQIKSFSPEYSGNIKAVYTPVITGVDLGVDVPQAHVALSTNATVGVMVGSETESKDITGYLTGGGALTWSPADETGNHDTCYNASLSLSTSSSVSGVKYSVASVLKLCINGLEVEGAGWVDSDTQTLNVSFPNTGPYEYASYEGFDDVSLTYAEAFGYQTRQDAGQTESWGLPKQVVVTYKCGETEVLDMNWDAVGGFSKDDYGEQTLTATGKIGFPSDVDNEGAPESVSVTVHVAAANKLDVPTASPDGGTYESAQRVSLSCEEKDATTYYTLDGTEPTEEGLVYDGDPIDISSTATLKAKAFGEGYAPSDTATFEYVIEGAKPDPEPEPEPEPSPATYTVAFVTGEGSAVASQVVESGKCATRPDDPTRDGYGFAGWFTDEACSAAYDFATPVTADLTLYAKWAEKAGPTPKPDPEPGPDPEPEPEPSPVSYTVTFVTGEGSAVASQSVESGECATKPDEPTCEGYSFAGWFTDEACTAAYDFATPVTTELTLYAKWTEKADPEPEPSPTPATRHTVTFDSMGGSEVAEQVVADGAFVERPADPTREGYVFTGWCTDESLNEEYYFGTEVRADLTLYAKWAVKSDDQGGDTDGGDSGKSDGSADDSQPDASGKTNKRGGVLPTTGDALAIASLVAAAGIPLGVAGAFLYRRR